MTYSEMFKGRILYLSDLQTKDAKEVIRKISRNYSFGGKKGKINANIELLANAVDAYIEEENAFYLYSAAELLWDLLPDNSLEAHALLNALAIMQSYKSTIQIIKPDNMGVDARQFVGEKLRRK